MTNKISGCCGSSEQTDAPFNSDGGFCADCREHCTYIAFEDSDGNETPAFRYEPESPIFQCAHCGNAFESKYPMTNSLFDCGCTEASIDGFETADGEPAMMFVLANGMLSETPMQTPYTPYQQPGVPTIDPVEPYAQGDFKPSTGEIVATAAVVIAIFTFTVLLQAAGY